MAKSKNTIVVVFLAEAALLAAWSRASPEAIGSGKFTGTLLRPDLNQRKETN